MGQKQSQTPSAGKRSPDVEQLTDKGQRSLLISPQKCQGNALDSERFINPREPVVLLLGPVGVGKSSLANFLVGLEKNGYFKESSGSESKTTECDVRSNKVEGFSVVDTPGFFDVAGDDVTLEKIRNYLEVNPISCIAVVLDQQTVRMDQKISDLLAIASLAAEIDEQPRICIVFNRFSHLAQDEIRRLDTFEDEISQFEANSEMLLELEQFQKESCAAQCSPIVSNKWKSKIPLIRRVADCLSDKLLTRHKKAEIWESIFFLDSRYKHCQISEAEALNEAKEQFENFKKWVTKQQRTQFHIAKHVRMGDITNELSKKLENYESFKFEGVRNKLYRVQRDFADREILRGLENDFSDADLCEFAEKIYEGRREFHSALDSKVRVSNDYNVTVLNEHWFEKFDPGPTYVILKKGTAICVVFKGTEASRPDEIVSNINVKSTEIQIGPDRNDVIRTHSGFRAILSQPDKKGMTWYERIWAEIASTWDGCKRLIYTGHSLGGALAIVCRAYHLKESSSCPNTLCIESVTFGAPLVLGKNSSQTRLDQLEKNSRNYVFGSDVVPRLLRWREGEKGVNYEKARNFLVLSYEASVAKENLALCGFSGTGAVIFVASKALEAVIGTAAAPVAIVCALVPVGLVVYRWATTNALLSVDIVRTFMTDVSNANYIPNGKTIEMLVWTPLDEINSSEKDTAIKHHAPKRYSAFMRALQDKMTKREWVDMAKSPTELYESLGVKPFVTFDEQKK